MSNEYIYILLTSVAIKQALIITILVYLNYWWYNKIWYTCFKIDV